MAGIASLAVEVVQQRIIAHLTLSNPSKSDVLYIEKSKALATPLLRNKLFSIKCQGEEIPYLGAMAKRTPPGPDDYLRLLPGAELKRSTDITELYDFLPGAHTYTIEYRAFHGDPNDDTKLVELKSNQASFVFSR